MKIYQDKNSSKIIVLSNTMENEASGKSPDNSKIFNINLKKDYSDIFSKKELESFNISNEIVNRSIQEAYQRNTILDRDDVEDNLIARDNIVNTRDGQRSIAYDDTYPDLHNESNNSQESSSFYYPGSSVDASIFFNDSIKVYNHNQNNLNIFTPTSLSNLLSRSLKSTEDFDINIFSHEIVNLGRSSKKNFDSNLLFLYQSDINNDTILNLKSESLNRVESISDRLFKFINIKNHDNLIRKNYKESIALYNDLDDATTFANNLEKDINFGNIAERFVLNGYGKLNGKISNIILNNQESFINFSGNNDERLIDKQLGNETSIISTDDLRIFYENISGFKISTKNENFKESFLNYEIINSDRIAGQLFLNCAISSYILYPNIDDIESNSLKVKRDRVNSTALQSYPIIQIANLSPNSSMFSNNNYDIIGIKGKSYNSNILKEYSNPEKLSIFTSGNFDEKTIFKTQLDRSFLYFNRRSYIGSKFKQSTDFKNNIFSFTINSRQAENQSIYENIFFDVKSTYPHVTPFFIQLPTRFFINNTVSNDEWPNTLRIFNDQRYQIFLSETNSILNTFKSKLGVNLSSRADIESFDQIKKSIVEIRTIFDQLFGFTILGRYVDNISSNIDSFFPNYFSNQRRQYNIEFNSTSEQLSGIARGLDFDLMKAEELLDNYFTSNTYQEPAGVESISDFSGNEIESTHDIRSNFNSSIANSATNDLNNNDFLSESFIFSSSNSLLDISELNMFSFRRFPIESSKYSVKYIKTFEEKWLNKRKVSENLKKVTQYDQKSIDNYIVKTSSGCNIARRNLSKKSSKFFEITEKANSKISQNEEFSLLYDKFEDTSINTFKDSQFISEGGVYKNNFAKKFNNKVENTASSFLDNSIDIKDKSHIFSSSEYREFLSKYYTKSFLRSKRLLLLKLLKENINIFSKGSRSYTNNEYFAFDVLMATSLSNKNNSDKNTNKETTSIILKNAMMNLAGIDNQFSNLKNQPIDSLEQFNLGITDIGKSVSANREYSLNNLLKKEFGKDKIEKIINSIFSIDTVKNQDNFVIRTLLKEEMKVDSFSISTKNAEGGFDLHNLPGYLCTLKFPFMIKKHDFTFPENRTIGKIQNFKELVDQAIDPVIEASMYHSNLVNLLKNFTYNHDIFINQENTGVVFYKNIKDEEKEFKAVEGYNFNTKEKEKGIVLNLNYFDFDFRHTNLIRELKNLNLNNVEVNNTFFESNFLNKKDKILVSYTEKGNNYKIPFSYFYLSNIPGTFSNKLTSIAEELFSIFKVKFNKINNTEDIDKFIENNSFYIRVLQEIYEVFSDIFVETYNIFNNILLENIKTGLEDKDIDRRNEFYNNLENYYSFVSSSNQEVKDLIVSDLLKIYNENISVEDDKKVKYNNRSDFVSIDDFINSSETYLYTGRYRKLQEVIRILNNSDISEAICHDMLHGYFLNFENNTEKLDINTIGLENSIININNKLFEIEESNFEDFNLFIKNEFYQNKISKKIQEIIFYKNLYNETFIKNNLFNTLKEKYESLNLFNHRKTFLQNMYNKSKASCLFLAKDIKENNTKKIDIIRFPIDYNFSSKIGERGIVEFSLLPVNIKYPEVEYKELKFYYTPFFTDVTSNFINDIDITQGNYLGFYNDAQKISNRYSVIDKFTAISEVKNELTNILSLGAETSAAIRFEDLNKVSRKIVDDCIMSNAIKDINFISQKNLDENVKITDDDITNLISGKTINILSSLSEDDIVKIFDSYNENEFDFNVREESYFNLDTNESIQALNDFYKKFLLEIDKDISESDILKSLIPDVFYDMFSIKVDRDKFIIKDSEDSILHRYGENILDNSKSNKCFTYYIGVRIL